MLHDVTHTATDPALGAAVLLILVGALLASLTLVFLLIEGLQVRATIRRRRRTRSQAYPFWSVPHA